MTDLSPAMQMQCHRVSQKACDTIFGLLTDGWKMQESKTTSGAVSYLPPDEMRWEYAELCEKRKPTLNQRLVMRSIELKFSNWCKDMKSIVEHRRKKCQKKQ